MMYSYPFFSFPHFRRFEARYYPTSYPYMRHTVRDNAKYGSNYNNSKSGSKYDDYEYGNAKLVQERSYNGQRHANSMSKSGTTKKEKSSPKRSFSGFSFLNNFLHQEDRDQDEEFFDLLGLKLYNDDLLLLGLIFFLYKEEVKDEYLFFALILLLLS